MAYTVLARKYRPQTFSDLVGQEHVTRTLGNAIASGRVAHAFLFTGVRGVGKTTTARILAKALNCANGPTSEPCGTCDPCREITSGVDLDVLEMDGASNNSVEDVRRLQESIPFRPARDRSKIVIVDEVHMLSTGAFNAFLKTLEEPPPHVKFIFATTESHKVPITIRSRCQRYDFRLIPQQVVAARVQEILSREGIEADDQAISIVARESAGSMRDALTLLDQIVAFAGTKLEGEEVARVLGIADRDLLHRAAACVLEGDGKGALEVVSALASRGLDMLHFSRAFTELTRDLVVLKVAGSNTELVPLVEEERRAAVELVSRVSELELQRAFASISLLVDEVAKASMPRLTLEMGLVRLATRPPLSAISEIVARLEALQQRSPSGTSSPRGGGGGGGGRGGPGRAPSPSATPDMATALIDKLRNPGARTEPAEAASRAERTETGPKRAASDALAAATALRDALLPEVLLPEAASTDSHEAMEPISTHEPAFADEPQSTHEPAFAHEATPVSTTVEVPPVAPRANRLASSDMTSRFEHVVAVLMETRPALGAVLLHATPTRVDAKELIIAFPPGSFYRRQADAPEAKNAIAEIAERVLGGRPRVEVIERGDEEARAPTIAELETERQRARWEATRKKALNHPIVVEALSIFEASAELAEVRLEGD